MIDFRGYEWVFWEGLKVTLMVGLATIPVALLLGLVGAWGKLANNRFANLVAGTYTTVVRGVPGRPRSA